MENKNNPVKPGKQEVGENHNNNNNSIPVIKIEIESLEKNSQNRLLLSATNLAAGILTNAQLEDSNSVGGKSLLTKFLEELKTNQNPEERAVLFTFMGNKLQYQQNNTISQIKSDESFKSEGERVYTKVHDRDQDSRKDEVSFKNGNWYQASLWSLLTGDKLSLELKAKFFTEFFSLMQSKEEFIDLLCCYAYDEHATFFTSLLQSPDASESLQKNKNIANIAAKIFQEKFQAELPIASFFPLAGMQLCDQLFSLNAGVFASLDTTEKDYNANFAEFSSNHLFKSRTSLFPQVVVQNICTYITSRLKENPSEEVKKTLLDMVYLLRNLELISLKDEFAKKLIELSESVLTEKEKEVPEMPENYDEALFLQGSKLGLLNSRTDFGISRALKFCAKDKNPELFKQLVALGLQTDRAQIDHDQLHAAFVYGNTKSEDQLQYYELALDCGFSCKLPIKFTHFLPYNKEIHSAFIDLIIKKHPKTLYMLCGVDDMKDNKLISAEQYDSYMKNFSAEDLLQAIINIEELSITGREFRKKIFARHLLERDIEEIKNAFSIIAQKDKDDNVVEKLECLVAIQNMLDIAKYSKDLAPAERIDYTKKIMAAAIASEVHTEGAANKFFENFQYLVLNLTSACKDDKALESELQKFFDIFCKNYTEEKPSILISEYFLPLAKFFQKHNVRFDIPFYEGKKTIGYALENPEVNLGQIRFRECPDDPYVAIDAIKDTKFQAIFTIIYLTSNISSNRIVDNNIINKYLNKEVLKDIVVDSKLHKKLEQIYTQRNEVGRLFDFQEEAKILYARNVLSACIETNSLEFFAKFLDNTARNTSDLQEKCILYAVLQDNLELLQNKSEFLEPLLDQIKPIKDDMIEELKCIELKFQNPASNKQIINPSLHKNEKYTFTNFLDKEKIVKLQDFILSNITLTNLPDKHFEKLGYGLPNRIFGQEPNFKSFEEYLKKNNHSTFKIMEMFTSINPKFKAEFLNKALKELSGTYTKLDENSGIAKVI